MTFASIAIFYQQGYYVYAIEFGVIIFIAMVFYTCKKKRDTLWNVTVEVEEIKEAKPVKIGIFLIAIVGLVKAFKEGVEITVDMKTLLAFAVLLSGCLEIALYNGAYHYLLKEKVFSEDINKALDKIKLPLIRWNFKFGKKNIQLPLPDLPKAWYTTTHVMNNVRMIIAIRQMNRNEDLEVLKRFTIFSDIDWELVEDLKAEELDKLADLFCIEKLRAIVLAERERLRQKQLQEAESTIIIIW